MTRRNSIWYSTVGRPRRFVRIGFFIKSPETAGMGTPAVPIYKKETERYDKENTLHYYGCGFGGKFKRVCGTESGGYSAERRTYSDNGREHCVFGQMERYGKGK